MGERSIENKARANAVASAQYLIMLISCASLFEWFSLIAFGWSSFLPDDANSAMQKIFVNYFCLTIVSFHNIWICIQFKMIQTMTFKKPPPPKKQIIKATAPNPSIVLAQQTVVDSSTIKL